MFEPIPGYDAWKTRTPEVDAPELGRPLQPDDVCECGCEHRHHNGTGQACWRCAELDQVCDGFELDWDRIEKDARADAENRAYDEWVDK